MYLINLVNYVDNKITRNPVGVINGDEAEALLWIGNNRGNLVSDEKVNGVCYPYYEQKYIQELN